MKKILLLFVLFIAGMSSCTKDTQSNLPTTYRLDYISDQVLGSHAGTSTTLLYNVIYVGPVQEHIDITLGGLPKGVVVDTTSPHSGVAPFTCYFTLTNDGTAAGGVYPIKVNCHGSKTGDKYYSFNLKVLREEQCTPMVTGVWKNNYDCNGNLYVDTVIVDPAGYSNRIYFKNFNGMGISLYADLDCSSGYVTIPSQTVAGHTYYGGGNFASGNMAYNFSDITSSGTTTCFDNMTK